MLHCNGVRMRDCISEGAPCDARPSSSARPLMAMNRSARNTVVKQFALSNFHVEHSARKASIYVNMPQRASIALEGVYWNGSMKAPVIEYVSGQVNLTDAGWWSDAFVIATRIDAPRLNIERCHSSLKIEQVTGGGKRAGALRLRDHSSTAVLKLTHVRIAKSSH
ncbi:MAG: hypothetical protein IPJ85_17955 [Flavobacteriales bacterium]|nr:hypothetical protein [Flavobacteriales bacterium]